MQRRVIAGPMSWLVAICANLLSGQEYYVGTLAGPANNPGAIDGPRSAARFSDPRGMALDRDGNLYVADRANCTIRKIDGDGNVTTLAGLAGEIGHTDGVGAAARFFWPSGVAVNESGDVYVADTENYTIRVIKKRDGVVSTVAGLAGNHGAVDGIGNAARFEQPTDLALDDRGNLYVADGFRIRRVSPLGEVTSVAILPYECDRIAVDKQGFIYVTTIGASLYRISPFGNIDTVPSMPLTPSDSITKYLLDSLGGGRCIAVDDSGTVYVGTYVRDKLFKITSDGIVTLVQQGFTSLESITVDRRNGDIYACERELSQIWKISPDGPMTAVAGPANSLEPAFYVNGPGRGFYYEPFIYSPSVAINSQSGNVVVADAGQIRQITPDGTTIPVAGRKFQFGDADGTGAAARFSEDCSVTTDSSGNIYVADRLYGTIRKITPAGKVTTLAVKPGPGGHLDGSGPHAAFSHPSSIAVDAGNNVYVADFSSIRKISPAGEVTTLAGSEYGSADGTGSEALFSNPQEVAVDSSGNLYVADTNNNTIRKITPAGRVTTLAGKAGSLGVRDGPGADARFREAYGVAVDGAGNVFVSERDYHPGEPNPGTVRKIDPSGMVTTLAGSFLEGNEAGVGLNAKFSGAAGVAVDTNGIIYVADSFSHNIRMLVPAIEDAATIDSAAGPTGVPRELDSFPQTATGWNWRIVRRPSNSRAQLSSTSVRNPTFTPDVDDVFVFELDARTASGRNVTRVTLNATLQSTAITSPLSAAGTVAHPFTYQITATGSPTQFSAKDLPSGLTLDPATGVISGVPVDPGRVVITAGASNGKSTVEMEIEFAFQDVAPITLSSLWGVFTFSVNRQTNICCLSGVLRNVPSGIGTETLPPGIDFAGKRFSIRVGNAQDIFTLNASGMGRSSSLGTIKLTRNLKSRDAAERGNLFFAAKLRATQAVEIRSLDQPPERVPLTAEIVFNENTFSATGQVIVRVNYSQGRFQKVK